MLNFFKNIFTPSNQKKTSNLKGEDFVKIYLDRAKRSFIEIKLLKESSCQDIHSNYHNEILAELMKGSSSLSSGSFNKLINANEFAFVILDEDNLFVELKLKMKDIPSKFLKKKNVNLFYLNVSQNKKDDFFDKNNSIDQSINSNNAHLNGITNQSGKHEDCIREGELMKYSSKHKKFDKRNVVLDKEKLIITKPKNKESTILLLSDIATVSKDISDRNIKEKFMFEITTYESDHYIFKSKHNSDLESWIESICIFLSLIRDNKFIIKYGEQINRLVKDSYEKSMKIVYSCLSLKGLISIKETRELLFKMYNDKFICNLLETVINYKSNIRYYKYLDAWKNFEEIFELLNLDNFELNTYFQPVQGHYTHYTNPENELNFLDNPENVSPRRKMTANSTNSDLEEIRNYANIKSSIRQPSFKKSSLLEGVRDRKVILENSQHSPKTKLKRKAENESESETLTDLNTEFSPQSIDNEISINNFPLKSKSDNNCALEKKLKITSTHNLVNLSTNLPHQEKGKNNKIILIKQLISFENLKFLKSLRYDLKTFINKCFSENNTGSEFNSKLHENLKSGLFNEIFDNILTKFLQVFYKSINTNPLFTSRIESILLFYFKIKNKINSHSLIDLENSMLQLQKMSTSMSEIKVEENGINTQNAQNTQNYNSNFAMSENILDKK